jgi:hypothetical protein
MHDHARNQAFRYKYHVYLYERRFLKAISDGMYGRRRELEYDL